MTERAAIHDDPDAAARAAAEQIAQRSGVPRHDVALVVGSGWLPAIDRVGAVRWRSAATDLPGFVAPGAAGHDGVVLSVATASSTRVLVFSGRTHLYEGRGVASVVHGVRTAAATGCRTIVLTNASGGLRNGWQPGTPVLIADHINLTGVSPLRGATFLDLTDLYSARLRVLCRRVDPTVAEAVYVQFRGPQYETPAEIEMVRRLGGELVGMSTAVEAIAAREAGMEVLGLSLVTNLAAGLGNEPLDHGDVLAVGATAAARMGDLLAGVVEQL